MLTAQVSTEVAQAIPRGALAITPFPAISLEPLARHLIPLSGEPTRCETCGGDGSSDWVGYGSQTVLGRAPCPACNGSGWSIGPASITVECEICNGSGQVQPSRLSRVAALLTDPCPDCPGSIAVILLAVVEVESLLVPTRVGGDPRLIYYHDAMMLLMHGEETDVSHLLPFFDSGTQWAAIARLDTTT